MLGLSRPAARILLALPPLLVALGSAPEARADVPPPTACDHNASVGQACTTAGDGTEDGTCEDATCSRYGLLPDGGLGVTEYACLLCELPDAGPVHDAGPSTEDGGPAPPSDAGPTANDGGPSGPTANHLTSSSSCAVSVVPGARGGAGLFALGGVGVALFAALRRRRKA